MILLPLAETEWDRHIYDITPYSKDKQRGSLVGWKFRLQVGFVVLSQKGILMFEVAAPPHHFSLRISISFYLLWQKQL